MHGIPDLLTRAEGRPDLDREALGAPDGGYSEREGANQGLELRQQHTERSRLRSMVRALKEPSLFLQVINAQIRLRAIRRLPLSTRLIGRARVCGGARIFFGERVLILASIVPLEIATIQGGRIEIGESTSINYGVSIGARELISIGKGCHIGQYVIINDNDFHDIEDKQRLPPSKPVILEDGVWLGARVIVQKGVRIGHDAVVSAGSVVTRDIPPRCVAAGMPARVVRWF